MNFPSRLLLAMLVASPAAILHAQAEPAQEAPPEPAQEQPPAADDQGPAAGNADADADAALSPDRQDDGPRTADVDSVRTDQAVPTGETGPPDWMFGTYCSRRLQPPVLIRRMTYRPDHSIEWRRDGAEQSLFGHWNIVASETNRAETVLTVELTGDQSYRSNVYFHIRQDDLAARRFFRVAIVDRTVMGWDDISWKCDQ